MKSIRVNYKLPPWMKEQIEVRKSRTGGNESKYIREALLRQFEWEDRNKKMICSNIKLTGGCQAIGCVYCHEL